MSNSHPLTDAGTRVVGINVTAMTINDGLQVAHASKKIDPNIFIVMGGQHISLAVQEQDVFPGTRDKLRLRIRELLSVDFDCTTDSQQYQFADPKLGTLADALNTMYRGEKRLEDFDATISRLHLTTIPEMIRKASELVNSKPTVNPREGIDRLQTRYHAILKEINRTLYTFIQDHLSLYNYDEDGNILEITQDRIKKILPNLEQLIRGIEDEVELFKAVTYE